MISKTITSLDIQTTPDKLTSLVLDMVKQFETDKFGAKMVSATVCTNVSNNQQLLTVKRAAGFSDGENVLIISMDDFATRFDKDMLEQIAYNKALKFLSDKGLGIYNKSDKSKMTLVNKNEIVREFKNKREEI